jgi:phospholipid/cholesterol/gamma-HCH transport system substrate-binding protein
MNRRRLTKAVAVVLVSLAITGVAFVVRQSYFGPKTITAYFASAPAIYPGDEVRIAGVDVGTIATITPHGDGVEFVMKVDRGVPIPADAKAVIVAENLIAARYVQLAPEYEASGPIMPDGAIIPIERTAVPVEWDDVKDQLMRLATDLGPKQAESATSVSRFVNSAADAMDGNGDKLRQTLAQLSGVARILANGSGSIVDIIKNLQTFVSALRDSNTQIVSFQDRLATLTSVIDDSKSDLDGAVRDLSVAVGDIQRFVAGSRNQTSEQIQRLANVTQNLVDHRMDVENLLHVAPTSLANYYNIYNADTGSSIGAFVFNNLSNPTFFFCGMIGALENTTAPETAKLCSTYLGPLLHSVSLNHLPFPINPLLSKSMDPSDIIYSDPNLAPGGSGPSPTAPEVPPAVSAYEGVTPGTPPFTGRPPGVPAPGAPGGLPPTTGSSVADLLLPAEAEPPTTSAGAPDPGQSAPDPAQSAPDPAQSAPATSEGTPPS